MTTPASTPTASTTAAAASPALGADPDRASTTATDTSPAVPAGADPAASTAPAAETPRETVGVFFDADGREHYASPVSKATRAKLASGEWGTEQPAPPFDPAGKNIADVVAYLEEHAEDQNEVARVKAAEGAGKDRQRIRDWPPAQ